MIKTKEIEVKGVEGKIVIKTLSLGDQADIADVAGEKRGSLMICTLNKSIVSAPFDFSIAGLRALDDDIGLDILKEVNALSAPLAQETKD